MMFMEYPSFQVKTKTMHMKLSCSLNIFPFILKNCFYNFFKILTPKLVLSRILCAGKERKQQSDYKFIYIF